MRYMMLMIPKVYANGQGAGHMPTKEEIEPMMAYNEQLQKAGVLVSLDGLHPATEGARVTYKGGKPVVTDGPFTETREVLGGYWIINVKSRSEAIEWARKIPAGPEDIVEVRRIQEMEEFPADAQQTLKNFEASRH